MSCPRPKHEDILVKNWMKDEIDKLKDSKILAKFICFAEEHGRAEPLKISARMAHIVKGTRQPTAYITLLIKNFFHDNP